MEGKKRNPDRQSIELGILGLGNIGSALGAYYEQTVFKTHVYTRWFETSLGLRACRFIVAVVTVLLSFAAGSFVFKTIFKSLLDDKLLYLWNRAVSFFAGNFYLFAGLRWVCFKLNLINTTIP
jgi:hypothetical protein